MPSKKLPTDEEVERRFNALPDAIADAFESSETARRILEIGRMSGIAIDKIGHVAREVGYVMLGFVRPTELVPDLIDIIGDKERVEKIATEINQKIFVPIRESLKQAYGDEWAGGLAAGAEKTAAPPPSAPKIAPPAPPKPLTPSKPAPPITGVREQGLGVRDRAAPAPEAPKGPQPLIIRPLPPMAGIEDQGLGIREQGIWVGGRAGPTPAAETKVVPRPTPSVEGPKPIPPKPMPPPVIQPRPAPAPPPAAPPPRPASIVTPPATLPMSEKPKPPLPPTPPTPQPTPPLKPKEKEAPVIRPLGMMPNEGDRGQGIGDRVERLIEKVEKPSVPQAPKPTLPSQPKEVAPPPSPPPLKPISPPPIPSKPAPPSPPIKSPYLITKEMMEREMERMRQRQGNRGQGIGDGGQGVGNEKTVKSEETSKAEIQLQPKKIPRPSALEKYTVDPYKEPIEGK